MCTPEEKIIVSMVAAIAQDLRKAIKNYQKYKTQDYLREIMKIENWFYDYYDKHYYENIFPSVSGAYIVNRIFKEFDFNY